MAIKTNYSAFYLFLSHWQFPCIILTQGQSDFCMVCYPNEYHYIKLKSVHFSLDHSKIFQSFVYIFKSWCGGWRDSQRLKALAVLPEGHGLISSNHTGPQNWGNSSPRGSNILWPQWALHTHVTQIYMLGKKKHPCTKK